MSADKYASIFSGQMKAIVYIYHNPFVLICSFPTFYILQVLSNFRVALDNVLK